jgi:hypothetical protein
MSVRVVHWQGVCDRCGEAAPDVQTTPEEAQQDADECPCWPDAAASGVPQEPR